MPSATATVAANGTIDARRDRVLASRTRKTPRTHAAAAQAAEAPREKPTMIPFVAPTKTSAATIFDERLRAYHPAIARNGNIITTIASRWEPPLCMFDVNL